MNTMPVPDKADPQRCPTGFIPRAAVLCAAFAFAFAMFGCDAVSTDVEPTHSFDEVAPPSLHRSGLLMGSIRLEGIDDPTGAFGVIEGIDLSGQRLGPITSAVDHDGIFSAVVPPGRYTVSYEAPAHIGQVRQQIDVDFAQKRRLAPMTLLRRRVQVRGRILLGDGGDASHNAAAVTVRLVTEDRLMREELPQMVLRVGALPDSLLEHTDAAGVFVLDDVPVEHPYILLAQHPAFVPGSAVISVPLTSGPVYELEDDLVLEPSHARVALNEGRGFTRTASVRLTVRAAEPLFEQIVINEIGMDAARPDDCGPAQSYAEDEERLDCVPTPLGRPVERATCHLVTLGPASPARRDPCGDIARDKHRFAVSLLDRHGSTTNLTEASIVFDDRPIGEEQVTLTVRPPMAEEGTPRVPGGHPAVPVRPEHGWFYLRGYTSPNGGALTLSADAADGETPRHTYTGCFEMTHHGSEATRCDVSSAYALLHVQQVPIPAMPPSAAAEPVANVPFRLHGRVRDGALNETPIAYDVCLDDVPPAPLGFKLYRDRAADETDQPAGDVRVYLPQPTAARASLLPQFVTRDPRVYFEFDQPLEDDNRCGLAGGRGRDLARIRIRDAVDEEDEKEIDVPERGPIGPVRWELPPGDRENRLFVTFEDLAGNATREEVWIIVDTEPPIAPRLVPRDEPLANGPLVDLRGFAARQHNGVYWTPHAEALDFIATSGDPRDDRERESQLRVYVTSQAEPVDATAAFHSRAPWIQVQWPEPLPEGPSIILGEFRDIAGNRALSDPVIVNVDRTPPTVSASVIGVQPFGRLSFVSTNIVPIALHLDSPEPHPELVRVTLSASDLDIDCRYLRGVDWEGRQGALHACATDPDSVELMCHGDTVPSFDSARVFQQQMDQPIAGIDGGQCLRVHSWDLVGNHHVNEAYIPINLDRQPPAPPQVRDAGRRQFHAGGDALYFHVLEIDFPAQIAADHAVEHRFAMQRSPAVPPVIYSHRWGVDPSLPNCPNDAKICSELTDGGLRFRLRVSPAFYGEYQNDPGAIRMEVRAVDRAGNVSDPTVFTCERDGNGTKCDRR